MQINFFLTLLIASAVPLFVGFVWYHPRVFGNAWMKSASLNEESLKQGPNMFLIFGLTYLLGFFISFLLSGIVIHQMGFYSMLQNHFKEPETMQLFTDVMAKYGNDFRYVQSRCTARRYHRCRTGIAGTGRECAVRT